MKIVLSEFIHCRYNHDGTGLSGDEYIVKFNMPCCGHKMKKRFPAVGNKPNLLQLFSERITLDLREIPCRGCGKILLETNEKIDLRLI